MGVRTIKIFISSPGDVVHERQIAKRVIAKLGKELAASVKLEALLWEDMPLQATTCFQEGIDRIINADVVDIAVFILWSRLGSPLGDKFVKPDGSLYKSGTEYEYEMMYAANQQSGTPAILAYIKNVPFTDVVAHFSEGIDNETINRQREYVQEFIKEKFYDAETQTVYGAYHQFDVPTTFEQRLTEHLRRQIIQILGHEPVPIEWEDNPYVGLRSFTYEENTVFYGRRHAINEIGETLVNCFPEKTLSMFILGESGSGKSSLVRAGLLPDIIELGWTENAKWKWFDIMPSQFQGNVYEGILSIFNKVLPTSEQTNEHILFFFDQFEEIFTDSQITEEERICVFDLLIKICSTNKIWMIFAMRNDFYHKFASYPALSELKSKSKIYDLPKILHSELQEIVEEPAKKAGLKWEVNEHGIPLNKTIIHDINLGIDDLALIEFALSELYNLKNENNQLTFEAYEKIGKINGAVIKYADDFYNSLTDEQKSLFYQLLSALITPSSESYVRKTALLKDLQKSEKHKSLIDELIDKHLLISGKTANGEATICIVHEILISSWQVIQEWIKQEKYFIDANNHYENLSNYWIRHNKSKKDLVKEKETIRESEYFLYSWSDYCPKNVRDFLHTSIEKYKRNFLPLIAILLVSDFLLFVIPGVFINDFLLLSLPFFTPITILLLYLIWEKSEGKPNFKTINVSVIIWSILFILLLLTSIFSFWAGNTWWCILWLLLPLSVLPKLTSVIIEKKEIQQWSKRIFKEKFKLSSNLKKWVMISIGMFYLFIFVIIFALGLLIFYMQKEQVAIQNEIIYGMFDDLNNKSSLTRSDQYYFNKTYYLGYLEDKTNLDVLLEGDTNYIYDRLALCHYKIGNPEYTIGYLNSNSIECMKLSILVYEELGEVSKAKEMLHSYKTALDKSDKGNEFDISMIRVAERLGEFGLLKDFYNQYLSNISDDPLVLLINAHNLLMTGEKDDAFRIYQDLIKTEKYENIIESDFAIFRWLGFDDTEISEMEKRLRLNRIPVYTLPSDDANTVNLKKSFIGKWEDDYDSGKWEINEDGYNISSYLSDDYFGVSRFRIKEVNQKLILEEYDYRNDNLFTSEIEKVSENEIHVKIIENGNVNMRDQIRIYKRVTE
jgi:hypothetical protein